MRKNEVNDVQKRNSYRKHHGVEDKQGLGPWMPAEEKLKVWREKRGQDAGGEEVVDRPKKPFRGWFGISFGS